MARLTGQRESPQDPPVSTSRPWDYKCAPHNLLLCGCRKIQNHVFPPVWQVLYPRSHLPSSRCLFDSSGRSCGLRLGHPHTPPALSASLLVTVLFSHTSFGDLLSGFSALLCRVPCLSLIDGVRIHRHFIILQMFPWTITYILTLSCCFSPGWSFKL